MKSEFNKKENQKPVSFNDLPVGILAEITDHICKEYIGCIVVKAWNGNVHILHDIDKRRKAVLNSWDYDNNFKNVFPKCFVRILDPDESVVLKND